MHDELNFYIPITMVDENFKRASAVNAAVDGKFYFRTNIFDSGKPKVEELTILEIFEGKVGPDLTSGRIYWIEPSLGSLLEERGRQAS